MKSTNHKILHGGLNARGYKIPGRYDVQVAKDLNQVLIHNEDLLGDNPLVDSAVQVGPVSVFFRNMASHLEQFILESDAVVGCVAWITHPDILNALSSCKGVSILLNKEDFLRPDLPTANGKLIHEAMGQTVGINRLHHEPVKELCYAETGDTEPFRCVGLAGKHNRPRLHHKFMVRLTVGWRRWEWIPTAVWTGSFNPTNNATMSLENAVVIRNKKIAEAYYWEWGQALAISEPLDWESPWVAPEYRIGS